MNITLNFLDIDPNDMIYKDYISVLNIFLSNRDYDNVILCWSFAKKSLHKWSDIDLFVIDDSVTKLVQSKEVINGIEIDILKCSMSNLVQILNDEKNSYIRRISNFLSSWIPFNSITKFEELIALAQETVHYQLPKLAEEELMQIKEFIASSKTLAKSYFDSYSDLSFYTRISSAIQSIISNYFKLNKQVIPNWKSIDESIYIWVFKNELNQFYTWTTKVDKYNSFILLLDELELLLKNYR